jgi:hypothetical protein
MQKSVVEAIFVLHRVLSGEETDRQNSPKSSKTVDAGGSDGVVNPGVDAQYVLRSVFTKIIFSFFLQLKNSFLILNNEMRLP